MFTGINYTNVAYEQDYLDHRRKMEGLIFRPQNLHEQRTELLAAGLTWTAKIHECHYADEDTHMGYHTSGSENAITARDGSLLYSYRNIDCGGEFCTAIDHPDGNRYIVFRRDLYGYSVLDTKTMEEFHYIPAESFRGGETFIWCELFFNPATCMAAVAGCFWASPYSVFIVDFANPMRQARQQDVIRHIRTDANGYEDCDFVKWDGQDLIVRVNDPIVVEVRVDADACSALLDAQP